MISVVREKDIFSYEGEKNVIVLPITSFVRKDGHLAVTNNVTKMFFDKYVNLSKKWGYMIENNVIYPSFTSSKTNLIGVVEKRHYASSVDEESIESSFWYIRENALLKSDYIFYLIPIGKESEEKRAKEVLNNLDNVVFLKEEMESV